MSEFWLRVLTTSALQHLWQSALLLVLAWLAIRLRPRFSARVQSRIWLCAFLLALVLPLAVLLPRFPTGGGDSCERLLHEHADDVHTIDRRTPDPLGVAWRRYRPPGVSCENMAHECRNNLGVVLAGRHTGWVMAFTVALGRSTQTPSGKRAIDWPHRTS